MITIDKTLFIFLGRWQHDSDLVSLPHIETEHLSRLYNHQPRLDCLPRLMNYVEQHSNERFLEKLLGDMLDNNQIRGIYQSLSVLPKIELHFTISGTIPAGSGRRRIDPDKPSELFKGEDYVLTLEPRRLNRGRQAKAVCPRFPKPKDENWVAILGTGEELLGLKRLSGHQNARIAFCTPEKVHKDIFSVTLYFMSDVYLGLDQQFEFKFRLKSRPQN